MIYLIAQRKVVLKRYGNSIEGHCLQKWNRRENQYGGLDLLKESGASQVRFRNLVRLQENLHTHYYRVFGCPLRSYVKENFFKPYNA